MLNSWNQPVLSNQGKVSCLRTQQESNSHLTDIHGLQVRYAIHVSMPLAIHLTVYVLDVFILLETWTFYSKTLSNLYWVTVFYRHTVTCRESSITWLFDAHPCSSYKQALNNDSLFYNLQQKLRQTFCRRSDALLDASWRLADREYVFLLAGIRIYLINYKLWKHTVTCNIITLPIKSDMTSVCVYIYEQLRLQSNPFS